MVFQKCFPNPPLVFVDSETVMSNKQRNQWTQFLINTHSHFTSQTHQTLLQHHLIHPHKKKKNLQQVLKKKKKKMMMESFKSWVSEHKLASIGGVWASAVGASLAYTSLGSHYKTSLRLIHARMHAQALTLGVLSGAAILHYYEKKKEAEEDHIKLG